MNKNKLKKLEKFAIDKKLMTKVKGGEATSTNFDWPLAKFFF
ncbi:hypothetical protein V9L05_04470 [Bernardetia sp. Wsw4-3y2]